LKQPNLASQKGPEESILAGGITCFPLLGTFQRLNHMSFWLLDDFVVLGWSWGFAFPRPNRAFWDWFFSSWPNFSIFSPGNSIFKLLLDLLVNLEIWSIAPISGSDARRITGVIRRALCGDRRICLCAAIRRCFVVAAHRRLMRRFRRFWRRLCAAFWELRSLGFPDGAILEQSNYLNGAIGLSPECRREPRQKRLGSLSTDRANSNKCRKVKTKLLLT